MIEKIASSSSAQSPPYDKTARNFLAAIHRAAATIWLNRRQALAQRARGVSRNDQNTNSELVGHEAKFVWIGKPACALQNPAQ